MFWHQSALCKVINQAANSVNSDLPPFSSVQATSLWRVSYHRRTKLLSRKTQERGSESLLCDILEVLPRLYYRKEGSSKHYCWISYIMLYGQLKILFTCCNDPIKCPAFFKRPPRISAQVISSMFNKRPALIKRPPQLSSHPIKERGALNRGLPYLKILLSYKKNTSLMLWTSSL